MGAVEEKIKTVSPTNLLEEMKLLKEMQQDQSGKLSITFIKYVLVSIGH